VPASASVIFYLPKISLGIFPLQIFTVFKILIQPGLTGSETNAGLFRGDPGHYRSSSGMIRLGTVRPPGETVVNRHGLCPMWRYGVFQVWPRCVTEECRRSADSCRSNYCLERYQPVNAGKVRWSHDMATVQTLEAIFTIILYKYPNRDQPGLYTGAM
jgi:hypothetical protein